MRRIVLSLVAAGAVIAAASPAAAQYYPNRPVPAPGYGNGYGHGYGYGQIRELQVRLDNIERQIDRLDRRDRIGDRTANRLREDANRIEERLHRRARGGLDPREAGDIQYRLQRLERQVQWARERRWDRFR
jgi:hypothetical protein